MLMFSTVLKKCIFYLVYFYHTHYPTLYQSGSQDKHCIRQEMFTFNDLMNTEPQTHRNTSFLFLHGLWDIENRGNREISCSNILLVSTSLKLIDELTIGKLNLTEWMLYSLIFYFQRKIFTGDIKMYLILKIIDNDGQRSYLKAM